MSRPNYDKSPVVEVPGHDSGCRRGWDAICAELNRAITAGLSKKRRWIVAVECYAGVHEEQVASQLRAGLTAAAHFLTTTGVFKSPSALERELAPYLGGDDPLFGFLSPLTIDTFLDGDKQQALRQHVETQEGAVIVFGTGSLRCVNADTIVYADMPRWEGQLRQRRGEVGNLGADNRGTKSSLQYKRSYFIDWRVCDRLKQESIATWDYLLDTTAAGTPKLVTGVALRAGLDHASSRPFRVVPFFDPAPWGGQWMKEVCDLDPTAPNYGWCFDCVPEENSLLLQYGDIRIEIPSTNLVYYKPRELLGEAVHGLFGPEFPIRFDFLDTIQGGNLSLQVHPLIGYIQEKFGMHYTQDESYYILDAGEDAAVYLGVLPNTSPDALFTALEKARGDVPFPAEQFVARWPARKHDHFSIPAGTIHCSGANAMVLEISATPYIFTFKLWDWGRMGLDGLPRPINLKHGRKNVQFDRDTDWVRTHLIDRVELLGRGGGWREERTGLHAAEFIETRRHWFTGAVPHDTRGGVNVLNLVEGREAIVESPTDAFAPFIVHYAETFIVPAAVGAYTIRPHGESVGAECATMKAYVRVFA